MDCPTCSRALVTLEFDELEVDYCTQCGGVWLDSGELEYLLSNGSDPDTHPTPFIPSLSSEKKKRCPVCRVMMEKIAAGQADSIILDQCKLHGIWFDRGELIRLMALERGTEASGQSNPLAARLHEMFPDMKEIP
ncbi:MAG TPA: hypothetical protein ENN34_13075 [Deltaproteobacteria bacterium]|nr:hypothetical protein [Deltaproteobacteria bacterium]